MKNKLNPKICLLNYGSGNITSVYNAVKFLGYSIKISNKTKDINESTHLIMPGVGAFDASMQKVNKNLPVKLLKKIINEKKIPFLGICLGMQVLSSFGHEFSKTNGLNLIGGEVVKIRCGNLRLPHIGWNKIFVKRNISILEELNEKDFYFIHSFYFKTYLNSNISAVTKYNHNFPCVINKNNIYGVQFHPEKSLTNGLKLLDNFVKKT